MYFFLPRVEPWAHIIWLVSMLTIINIRSQQPHVWMMINTHIAKYKNEWNMLKIIDLNISYAIHALFLLIITYIYLPKVYKCFAIKLLKLCVAKISVKMCLFWLDQTFFPPLNIKQHINIQMYARLTLLHGYKTWKKKTSFNEHKKLNKWFFHLNFRFNCAFVWGNPSHHSANKMTIQTNLC